MDEAERAHDAETGSGDESVTRETAEPFSAGAGSPTRVTARAPAHVTSFFAPAPDADPAVAGATGGGVALSDGIEVTVAPRHATSDGGDGTGSNGAGSSDSPHRITVNGDPASVAPVVGVLDRLDTPPARVAVESAVPVGAGFGVSAGATLGAAFAASVVFDVPRTTDALVGAAHAAEVVAGTGLGDAVAAAHGGVPLRLVPGDPEHGRVDGVVARPRIEYVSFGELSTPEVLAGDTSRVTAAGERALERVVSEPTVTAVFDAGRTFTETVGLADERVRETVRAVEAAGGRASMAMLGRTVVALGTGLSDAGFDPEVCTVDPAGVRLVDAE